MKIAHKQQIRAAIIGGIVACFLTLHFARAHADSVCAYFDHVLIRT